MFPELPKSAAKKKAKKAMHHFWPSKQENHNQLSRQNSCVKHKKVHQHKLP